MDRYFATVKGEAALFSKEDAHHLLNARRAEVGERFEISDGGDVYLAELASKKPFEVRIIKMIDRDSELPSKLIIAFSLLKGGHDDLVVMKATELGAASFIPFVSERTVVRLDEKGRKARSERFRRIAREAAMQSRRNLVPEVSEIASFKEAIGAEADVRFIAYEGIAGERGTLEKALKGVKPGSKTLAVAGPEGGFSEKEAHMAGEAGLSFVSLGSRILRAETASIYIASAFSYNIER